MVLAEIVLGSLSSSLSLFAAAAVTTADAATAATITAAAAKIQQFHKVKSRWVRPTGFYYLIISLNSSSLITLMPRALAFSSLLPASSPAKT